MSTIIPHAGHLTVILSAELDYLADEVNADRHADLRERLAYQLGIGELYSAQECSGSYKGTPERSLAITGPASKAMAVARHHAELFKQESFLAIDHHGQGKLYFTDNVGDSYTTIGLYTELESTDGVEAWTRVLATGETFTFI